MERKIKHEYLKRMSVSERILYYTGCIRFGRECLSNRVYSKKRRVAEVGIYLRLWHPLMLIASLIGLLDEIMIAVINWFNVRIEIAKDNAPMYYVMRVVDNENIESKTEEKK